MEMELESSKAPFHKSPPPERNDDDQDEESPLIKSEHPYPTSVFFIVVNEFCERFSYYGMRAILTLYLRNVLLYNEDAATVIFHTFIMICYVTPFLGAYISDAVIGKFKTIFYFSIIHAMGNVILSIAAFKNPPFPAVAFSLVGLFLTALGTGGIKPCVSAFGGDQFIVPGQERELEQYFFVFYFSINLGSLLSEIVTPILRRDVSCEGEDTCYPLAFGVPAILMLLALVIFVVGKPLYKIKEPTENIVVKIWKCVKHALTNRKEKLEVSHWLDYAKDKFEPSFVEDVKVLCSILVLFSPLPIFWALYEQQGSRWTFQASRMNGKVTDDFTIKPDQMQVVNSVLCIVLIPVFERLIYPALESCNLLINPLKRLGFGAFLVALSFVMAAVVELKMEGTYAVIPDQMESNVNFINSLPCTVNISLDKSVGGIGEPIEPHKIAPYDNYVYEKLRSWKYQVNIEPQEKNCIVNGSLMVFSPLDITVFSEEATSVLIKKGLDNKVGLLVPLNTDSLTKSPESNAKIRILYDNLPPAVDSIFLHSSKKDYKITIDTTDDSTMAREIQPRTYSVYESSNGIQGPQIGNISVEQGGSYLMAIFPNYNKTDDTMMKLYTITPPNSVHMFYIIPQFVVITIGEIFFAITGYEFSYAEAPVSMKSVIQSIWLFTIAIGNIIVILVTVLDIFGRDAVQYISFAILMILGDLVFMWLACNYKIKNPRGSYKPNKSLASPTTGERKSTAEEQQKAQTGSSQ